MKSIVRKTPVFVPATFAVLFAGCASAPPHDPPAVDITVPADWTSQVPAGERHGVPGLADSTEWWRDFGDDKLDALVEEALAHNYDIAAAAARVDQAAALARISGAGEWPQLAVGGRGSRSKQNIIGIPIPGTGGMITTRTNSFGVSLDASWEVDLWGRIRKGETAALADVEASWAELSGIKLSIAAQTVKAWFALSQSRLQTELAEKTVENYQTSADQVRKRYQQGVRNSLDLRLALANLAGAQALLEMRREQLDRTTRQLEILLGRYPSCRLEASGALPGVRGAVPAGLPSELLMRRPDLVAAERRYAAAQAKISEARRAFFPRITLTASGGTLTKQIEDVVNGDFSVWSIAAGITQPIFQGGRLRASLAQSHAAGDQALAAYASALLRAFGEVESAIVAEERLREREAYVVEAALQSEEARKLAERQYEAGLVDYITVLETQRRSLESQSNLIAVTGERLNARVNLHVALGGGFDLAGAWMDFLVDKSREKTTAEDSGKNE